MKKILSEYGIATEFIERKTIEGEVISASKVREYYENDFSACKKHLSSDVYELLEIKRSCNND